MVYGLAIVVGVVSFVALIFGALVAGSMWIAWWLLPVWDLVGVGILHLPPLTFWQFVAIKSFFGIMTHQLPSATVPKESKIDWNIYIGMLLASPITYFWIKWVLG